MRTLNVIKSCKTCFFFSFIAFVGRRVYGGKKLPSLVEIRNARCIAKPLPTNEYSAQTSFKEVEVRDDKWLQRSLETHCG